MKKVKLFLFVILFLFLITLPAFTQNTEEQTNYIDSAFLASPKGQTFKSSIILFIYDLKPQNYTTVWNLETKSIKLSSFKEKDYLSFYFTSQNVYNSIRSNKYDIGKKLFDDVVRKVLNPLNDNLGESKYFFGYDITVIGYTKSFIDKYASNQDITYRFLIPKEVVRKYKLKDISGQQVIDSSIILMDDERIDLKLQ